MYFEDFISKKNKWSENNSIGEYIIYLHQKNINIPQNIYDDLSQYITSPDEYTIYGCKYNGFVIIHDMSENKTLNVEGYALESFTFSNLYLLAVKLGLTDLMRNLKSIGELKLLIEDTLIVTHRMF